MNSRILFRSYVSTDTGNPASNSDCTIWQAARATSAAPTFFNPITTDRQADVDGATGLFNPVEVLLEEARIVWPNALSRMQSIVSIGTGIPELKDFGVDLKDILPTLKSIATETEQTHLRFLRNHADLGLSGRYFRFNVPLGLVDVRLDDRTGISTIEAAAESYLDSPEAQTLIMSFAMATSPGRGNILPNISIPA
jgi:predicted acylesterase/phospholipase RssA